ncbi:MAG: hypothetical protein AAFO79_08950 [Pseudomonadota bacterium]
MTHEQKSSRFDEQTDASVEADFASDKMGNNQLEGNDQQNVRNQRQAVPDVRTTTDGIIESAEKTDKDVRARRDLNKGAGVHPEKGEGGERNPGG